MADDLPPNLDIYAFLGISSTATASEIGKAYRKQSLLYHPDKNPSPSAVEKLHHLNLAKDLLLSPTARTAYDNVRKAKAAKAVRTAKYDDERKKMQRDLEFREREAKRRKTERMSGINIAEQEELNLKMAVEKLKEESERLKRERDNRIQEENVVETTDEGERTIKVRFRKGWDRSTFSANDVEDLFSRYGSVENVILGKSALVVFVTVSEAKAATKATSSGDPAFAMVKEITMVQISASPHATTNFEINGEIAQHVASLPVVAPQVTPQIAPQKAPAISSAPKFSFKPSFGNSNGADYESVTLLRMRKIEKERLEREIREREEKEDQVVV
jgi:DnaJ family protein C protein 17